MVAAGGGVTPLPELAVATETTRTPLRVRRLAEPTPHRTIGLVWRQSSRAVGVSPPHDAGFPRVAILCVVCRAS
jgi:DNA-binding transcriptional LysR family regulator